MVMARSYSLPPYREGGGRVLFWEQFSPFYFSAFHYKDSVTSYFGILVSINALKAAR